METWGELFWDAWIRLRLWCRSLYRTYWPTQIKAWQICTATGIVSVILTLLALNFQTAPAKTAVVAATGKPVNPSVALVSKKLEATKDPFADPELTGDTALEQNLVDGQALTRVDSVSLGVLDATEHPDPGFEPIGARKFKQALPAGEELATAESVPPQSSTDLTPLPVSAETAPVAVPETELSLPPDVLETTPVTEPKLDTAATDLFEEQPAALSLTEGTPAFETGGETVAEPVADPTAEAKLQAGPNRGPKHYSRLGHHEDNEEDRHSVRDIRVAPSTEVPEPVQHQPLVSQIRSSSHYSRLGKHEDSEEDRHSVREIRPTRIEVVLIPGRDAARLTAQETTPAAAEQPPKNEAPAIGNDLTPAVPVDTVPQDQGETPFKPTPALRTPEQDPFAAEQPAAVARVINEPLVEAPPPVLFAPESSADNLNSKPGEYHGPVLSSDGVDHEAHQAEDAFSRTKRKTPLLNDPPAVPPIRPAEPAVVQRGKPVEPSTEPRALRREPPREIQNYDPGHAATEVVVPNRRVVPMAVPDAVRQRSPERITVPDRLPLDEPSERSESRGRTESAFAVPPTTQSVRPESAPRLVMAITGPKQALVGSQVVWHFKIQNLGTVPATGILVSNVLPPGVQHRLSPDLEFAIDRLDPGQSRETNLTVQCVSAGTITNRAVLQADGDLSTDAEIQIEVTSPGNAIPAGKSPLTVAHHGPERWMVDSTGQFLVTVTNSSTERLKNVTICQTYPKGTKMVHATIGSRLDETSRTVSWTIADFAPGAAYILETELHSLAGGPATSSVRVKVGETLVAEELWTAVSSIADGRP